MDRETQIRPNNLKKNLIKHAQAQKINCYSRQVHTLREARRLSNIDASRGLVKISAS